MRKPESCTGDAAVNVRHTAGNTLQTSDYNVYSWTMFAPESIKKSREEAFLWKDPGRHLNSEKHSPEKGTGTGLPLRKRGGTD